MSTDPAADVDPEALLDRLVAAGVVDEFDDGTLVTTDEFESTHAVYRDSYLDADDARFHDSVADAFGLDRSEAERRVDELGVTRAELAAYLALQSFLDDPPAQPALATMAALVVEIEPASPIPDGQHELTDETYEMFRTEHPDAAVFVWKRDCKPCEAMKADLPEILDALPADVESAGVAVGDDATEFLRAFDVSKAPTLLLFRDGDVADRLEGRQQPLDVKEAADRVYGDAEN
ncbi:thioredoxin family protein [Halobaculum sp. D14]|uniref:thioredoxin family protein n=1 Tax=unclassified Halobaculum TaxID=2640896 RepID=UPI003EC04575